jgi:hypothetical protein
MSTSVTLQTKDGRIVQGINYTVNATTLPSDPAALGAAMQGGVAYGMYRIHGPLGWEYIPASEIQSVLHISAGAQT